MAPPRKCKAANGSEAGTIGKRGGSRAPNQQVVVDGPAGRTRKRTKEEESVALQNVTVECEDVMDVVKKVVEVAVKDANSGLMDLVNEALRKAFGEAEKKRQREENEKQQKQEEAFERRMMEFEGRMKQEFGRMERNFESVGLSHELFDGKLKLIEIGMERNRLTMTRLETMVRELLEEQKKEKAERTPEGLQGESIADVIIEGSDGIYSRDDEEEAAEAAAEVLISNAPAVPIIEHDDVDMASGDEADEAEADGDEAEGEPEMENRSVEAEDVGARIAGNDPEEDDDDDMMEDEDMERLSDDSDYVPSSVESDELHLTRASRSPSVVSQTPTLESRTPASRNQPAEARRNDQRTRGTGSHRSSRERSRSRSEHRQHQPDMDDSAFEVVESDQRLVESPETGEPDEVLSTEELCGIPDAELANYRITYTYPNPLVIELIEPVNERELSPNGPQMVPRNVPLNVENFEQEGGVSSSNPASQNQTPAIAPAPGITFDEHELAYQNVADTEMRDIETPAVVRPVPKYASVLNNMGLDEGESSSNASSQQQELPSADGVQNWSYGEEYNAEVAGPVMQRIPGDEDDNRRMAHQNEGNVEARADVPGRAPSPPVLAANEALCDFYTLVFGFDTMVEVSFQLVQKNEQLFYEQIGQIFLFSENERCEWFVENSSLLEKCVTRLASPLDQTNYRQLWEDCGSFVVNRWPHHQNIEARKNALRDTTWDTEDIRFRKKWVARLEKLSDRAKGEMIFGCWLKNIFGVPRTQLESEIGSVIPVQFNQLEDQSEATKNANIALNRIKLDRNYQDELVNSWRRTKSSTQIANMLGVHVEPKRCRQ